MKKEEEPSAKGTLYLVPTPLDEQQLSWQGQDVVRAITGLKFYIVEKAKTARHWIKSIVPGIDLPSLTMYELDKYNSNQDMLTLLKPLLEGHDMGLMSEAGYPCIADPGHLVVSMAHRKGIQVRPLVGPSSIVMALIASGFNGQSFVFHGYLPHKKENLSAKLKTMEISAAKYNQTQLFMETPYRNGFMLETLCSQLKPATLLSVACDIGSASESIQTMPISQWSKVDKNAYHKRPAIFSIGTQ